MLAAVALSGALPTGAFAAGGQVGILAGSVSDAGGNAIAGASVDVAAPTGSYHAVTGAGGTFTIVGVTVDTYVVSASAKGYQTTVQHDVTVTRDTRTSLAIRLARVVATIGRAGTRSLSSAFQPTQTNDSYTIDGARLAQTVGSPANQNLNDLVLAAPGVTLNSWGNPTIRGGAPGEVAYHFDGVPFNEPTVGRGGSTAPFTPGIFSGLSSVQVVEGAGDAGQGDLGSGVINLIPKRGTRPAAGAATLQIGGPNYNNFAGAEYGFATPDGRISNYFSMQWNRYAPYFGFHSENQSTSGNYFQASLVNNSQLLDNFVWKFGRHNDQSLQVLYANVSQIQWGNLGGIPTGTYPANPNALAWYPFDTLALGPFAALYSFVAPAPYTPSANVPVPGPEMQASTQTRFLKFEYDNSFSPSTYLALRYYNWSQLSYNQDLYDLGPAQQGLGTYTITGGPTVGTSFDLTHSFNDRLAVTLNGEYNTIHPILNFWVPLLSLIDPLLGDFMPAASGCPVAGQGVGYVSCAYGAGTVLEPTVGVNTNGSFFQNYGAGLRVQYSPTDRWHFDVGVRFEGQHQHWFNPIGNPSGINNPFDVSPALWSSNVIDPSTWEPRFSVNYQLGTNDAMRASFGRSAVFMTAQTLGTPLGLYGNLAALAALPPNTAGLTPAQIATQCGISPSVMPGAKQFPCQNYLQQFYWATDALIAPDGGGTQPAFYTNYDFSYSHEFANGIAMKVTPYYKFGTNLPAFTFLFSLPGGASVFAGGSKGQNRTTGVALNVTTPERQSGFSGFLSGTYQNVLQSAPPFINGQASGVPQLSFASTALGDVYRAGYVSPASIRIGGTYRFKDGLSITPVIEIDSGYPYNVGELIASGGPGSLCPQSAPANFPQVNFGCGVIPSGFQGYQNTTGTALNTNYYDPAYSGSSAKPNVAASRGNPTSANSGGVTWTPNVRLDLTIQYKRGRDTFGITFVNLGDNGYNGATPSVNPFYQPVANGVSGPQTGQNTCQTAYGSARGCAAIPVNAYAFSNGSYILTNNNVGQAPSFALAPLAQTQINLFYRRQF